ASVPARAVFFEAGFDGSWEPGDVGEVKNPSVSVPPARSSIPNAIAFVPRGSDASWVAWAVPLHVPASDSRKKPPKRGAARPVVRLEVDSSRYDRFAATENPPPAPPT